MGEAKKDGAKTESRRKSFTYIGAIDTHGQETHPHQGLYMYSTLHFRYVHTNKLNRFILSLLICVSTFHPSPVPSQESIPPPSPTQIIPHPNPYTKD